MEHDENSSRKTFWTERTCDRYSSFGRLLAAVRELRSQGAPYRVADRPAIERFAALVAEATDILGRLRHPETTGFYYRKGSGCSRDGSAYEGVLERFSRVRAMVNDHPQQVLERQLQELEVEYGRRVGVMEQHPSMGLGFSMHSLSSRIAYLQYILDLKLALGYAESLRSYVAGVKRLADNSQ